MPMGDAMYNGTILCMLVKQVIDTICFLFGLSASVLPVA
jgi:hypothetical protein